MSIFMFFFNDTATTEIYTLSLHDALPISRKLAGGEPVRARRTSLRLTQGRHFVKKTALTFAAAGLGLALATGAHAQQKDRKRTRLNSSHANISYVGFCL